MCFVDIYEVGMSNLGIQILYDILNKTDNIVCERCFAPWSDLGKILKEKDIPLSSIETGTPLKDFDIIGFSVPYEMSYSNILYMLDLAKIPFRAADRGDDYPLIIGGGPASANPEPIIDFFDAFFKRCKHLGIVTPNVLCKPVCAETTLHICDPKLFARCL